MTISIIIATFNAASTLRQCLDSIVPQLNGDAELIIIDGMSKDNTCSIISSYGDKVSYSISEKDKGIYDAWNKGIKVAKGDWICFIGADDVLIPNALDSFRKAIANHPNINEYDYICAHNEYVDLNGKFIKQIGGEPKWSSMKKRNAAAHVASLHSRRNLFGSIGIYDLHYKISADYELLVRKKEHLRYLYLDDVVIARMKVGGMSFSTAALKEVYKIRKQHKTVSRIDNLFLFLKDWIAFRLFVIRNTIKGSTVS